FSNNAMKVCGIWGSHAAMLDGVSPSVESLRTETFDLILLTVKSYDTEQAVSQIMPLLKEQSLIVSAQNGYGNYETIARHAGAGHTLLARIIFGARIVEPGLADVTVIADDVRIGQPAGAVAEQRIREIAASFRAAGIPTSYATDVYAILWAKILYNCALNPLGALLECSYGALADHIETKTIMNNIITEIFGVMKAHSIKVQWKKAEDYLKVFYTKLVPPTRDHYPSMYHDLKAGKKLEIDALNGAIVQLAREKGIAVPVNEAITDLVKARELLKTPHP
ncbi:MAG TPA: ketopantoate reductase family protein, partial [Dissulfurispiraceae bacterium]|nr:ketopantoate reductase family protein [Dissulfurispiraceae bacterium]